MDKNLRNRVIKAVRATPAARARKAQEKREEAAAVAAWEAFMATPEAAAAIAAAAAAEAVVLEQIAASAAGLAAYAREPLERLVHPLDDEWNGAAIAAMRRTAEIASWAAQLSRLSTELKPLAFQHSLALVGITKA